MFSNKATPRYYGEFREKVIRGEIPVCQNISLEMNRIDSLIRNPNIYYDSDEVEYYIRFCENELTLTEGGDLYLLDTFKLWAEQLYSWFYFVDEDVWEPYKNRSGGRFVRKTVKKRLVNKQFLIIPRSAAKTLYATTIQAYRLTVDRSTTNQIAVAPTMNQADETLKPFRTAITKARGPLFQFLTEGSLQNTTGSKLNRKRLASTKKGIENFLTNSLLETRPMSIAKLQGRRDAVATLDEWLSCDIRENPIDAIEQGAAKVQDYIILAVSSEGTIRNGIGDTIKMELKQILNGEIEDPHVSIFYYQLDSIDEVGNPECWLKANPNLGKTVSYERYMRDVKKAEASPSSRNDILAKRFNIPMEGFTYFFTYEETIPHRERNFDKMPCSLGADLSRGDDFCAFTFLFPLRGGMFGVKTRAYITERTLRRLPEAMRQKYEEFIKEDSLCIMSEYVLDMDNVFDELDGYINEHQYDVRTFGYDPYNAKEFVARWERENGAYGIVKVIQGAKTESVPLGELKQMSEDRALLFDQSLMSFTMGHCIVMEDTNGNRKLLKKRHDEKIDNVAAMMDAYVAYKANKDAFE